MLLWQTYENRLNFFITYILSNTRFLISAKRLAFILVLRQAQHKLRQARQIYFYFKIYSRTQLYQILKL